jgi:hypothetical protein
LVRRTYKTPVTKIYKRAKTYKIMSRRVKYTAWKDKICQTIGKESHTIKHNSNDPYFMKDTAGLSCPI